MLQVWGLAAVNIDSEELRGAPGGFDAQREQAFICNLQVGEERPAPGIIASQALHLRALLLLRCCDVEYYQ